MSRRARASFALSVAVSVLLVVGYAAVRVDTAGTPYARQLPDRAASDSYLVGAYYYPWYGPGAVKWQDGHLEQPEQGEYSSADQSVIDQQIELATAYGIDFFVVSWWGQGTSTDVVLQHSVLSSALAHDIDFAINYESDGRLIESDGRINLDDSRNQKTLASDVRYLAARYWTNPQYLRVNGANVLMLYSSHKFTGDVAGELARLRQQSAADGFSMYLVGDEVSWGGAGQEDPGRLQAFDAITAYNMYSPNPDSDRFSDSVSSEYSAWQQMADSHAVAFVPDAVPGYDDSATRPDAMHPPLPPNPALFGKLLDVALAHIEPPTNMLLITSWNEWNEATAIEPNVQFGRQYLDALERALENASPTPVVVLAPAV
jgi:glycoprotein endo-alpha-1,2-mannosidase